MNGTTHAIFGVGALAGAALALDVEPALYAYPVAVVAAWLPDVDNPRSTLGNGLSRRKNPIANAVTRPVSWMLRTASFTLVRVVGHRTLTHSLLGMAIFLLPSWLLLGSFPDLILALSAGCVSHVVADSLNKPGVPLLWPLRWRFRLLPGGMRSGGIAEFFVAATILILTAWAIYEVYPAIGRLLAQS
ncbi:MAG: metal-dependent hydrolase [Rubrobacteraceae bacterium]|jgi:inner membrane protein